MVAVGLQSIGYRQFYARVFERTGIDILEDDMTSLFLRKEDADKLWRSVRRRKVSSKVSRMRDHYRRLREGVKKLKADNKKAFSYESGMMGPAGGEELIHPAEGKGTKGKKRKRRRKTAIDGPPCGHCGITGHSRTSHFECLKNKGRKQARTDAVVVVVGR